MFEARLLIRDDDLEATGAATFDRRDPATGDIVTRAAAATIRDAERAANAAAAAFPGWSATGPSERRAILNRAADILVERRAEFEDMITAETGATMAWAAFNVDFGASILRDAAAMTTQVSGEVIPSDRPNSLALAVRQAAGVCLGIASWNGPAILGIRAVAMPLACGNTVVMKGSDICPGSHRLVGDVLRQAGLPAGAINVVTSSPDDAHRVVEALIAHPVVRRVNFTGSTRVGRIVAETAARHLKRCLLELSGKSPLIVLDDADIDEAVAAAAFGAFVNQGQICMSTERIIVVDAVADRFVAKLAAKAATLVAGDPRHPATLLGPMISADAVWRVQSMVDDAVHKGATLVCGGGGRGSMMDATVVDRVTPAMRIYGEESFGPIVGIIRVTDEDEAVTVANDNEFALSAAVFGRDVGRALAVARRIESGICHINSATVADEPQMPFGGFKSSGYGRFGGKAAIDEFTELRWISIQTGKQTYPL